MNAVRRAGRWMWQFVIGDDWTVAAVVAAGLAVVAWADRDGLAAWWIAPLAVVTALVVSLARAARTASRRRDQPE